MRTYVKSRPAAKRSSVGAIMINSPGVICPSGYHPLSDTPEVAAALIGCRPQLIRIQAEIAPQKLGFPVVRVGNRTKIPKKTLLAFCGME